MSSDTPLTSADGTRFTAYTAGNPATAKAAIVVLQEIFGVNGHIRKVADLYAAEGYFVVAPDMFGRVSPQTQLGYTPEDMPRGFGFKTEAEKDVSKLLQDLQAAINHASGAAQQRKVGVVGYCWGGLMTWRAAQRLQNVSACVPYYGGGMQRELELPLKCPVMAHLSDNDDYVPMSGVAALQQAYPAAQVHIYPAKHGFNCDERPSFDAAAQSLAWERSKAFFAKHLS